MQRTLILDDVEEIPEELGTKLPKDAVSTLREQDFDKEYIISPSKLPSDSNKLVIDRVFNHYKEVSADGDERKELVEFSNAILDVLTDKSGPIKYFDYEDTPPNEVDFTKLIQIYNYKKTFKYSLHDTLVRFFMLNFKNIPGKVYPLIVIDKEKKNFKLNELIQKLQESKEDFDINKYITDNYFFLHYMKDRSKRILLYHIIDYYEKNNKYDISIIKYFKIGRAHV